MLNSALKQLQHALRNLVGLRHHGRACLLQYLCTAQIGRLFGEISINNPSSSSRKIFCLNLNVVDSILKSALHCT